MKPGTASRIVRAIVKDFTDRRGLRHAWDDVDREIQAEILREWRRLVSQALKAP